jgi:hypothetical protein
MADLEPLRGEPIVAPIGVEVLLGCKAVKIFGVIAVLQLREKRLRLRVVTFAEECFSSLKPSSTNELNVNVTSRIERRHLGFVDQESIAWDASREQLDAQKLQRLIAISVAIGDRRLNEPADFRKIDRNRSETEAGEQVIFVHGDIKSFLSMAI